MNIIGLDLSLTSTGVARADGSSLRIRSKKTGPERLHEIQEAVAILIRGADLCIIEGYSYGSKGRSVFQIGELGGVIRHFLWEYGLPYVEVAPSALKKFATGRGNAGKDEVLAAAIRRLDYQGSSNDEADALFLRHMALTHYELSVIPFPQAHLEALAKVEWPAL